MYRGMIQKITVVAGRALPMRGNDIDTDRIMPARYLRAVTFDGLERYLFEDERAGSAAGAQSAATHPFDDTRFHGAAILLVNRNFGCGSSREHAPQGLYRAGFRALVGESFSEIFFGNSLIIGLPCITAAPADLQSLMERVESRPATTLRLDLTALTCTTDDGFTCAVSLPSHARDALVTGAWDTTGLLLDRYEDVDAVAARLPYVQGFQGASAS